MKLATGYDTIRKRYYHTEDTGVLGPRSKKQYQFLTSEADITVFGGAAGSGKSYCGLMDVLKWVHDPLFRGVVFRRTTPQLKGVGGMWDIGGSMFERAVGKAGKLRSSEPASKFVFPSKAQIHMQHMQYEKDKFNIQGWQISEALVDEATQFTETQIMYIISRLRTDAAMKSHLKMTCNPDADSFLRTWLDTAGYLDKNGYAIEGRSGKMVFCGTVNGSMRFARSKVAWVKEYPNVNPMTFTFIPATCRDNPILLRDEPDYLTKLENLPRVEKARLLDGNWFVREESEGYFSRDWCEIISGYDVPMGTQRVRSWDKAATLPSETYPDPDYTVGLKGTRCPSGDVIIMDMQKFRGRPADVQNRIESCVDTDGIDTLVTIPKDPGAAGKSEAQNCAGKLFEKGASVRIKQTSLSKLKRFEPVSAMAENGMVKVVKGSWNEDFFNELERFTGETRSKIHDDVADALADLCHELCQRASPGKFQLPNMKSLTQANPYKR